MLVSYLNIESAVKRANRSQFRICAALGCGAMAFSCTMKVTLGDAYGLGYFSANLMFLGQRGGEHKITGRKISSANPCLLLYPKIIAIP